MDSQTEQELVSSLKALDTHMIYLRDEISKVAVLQETLQGLQLSDVQKTVELQAIKNSVQTLVQKIEGTGDIEPLPSRVKTLETAVFVKNINSRISALENKDESFKRDILEHSLKLKKAEDFIEHAKKGDAEIKKEKIKAIVQITASILSFVGAAIAVIVSLL